MCKKKKKSQGHKAATPTPYYPCDRLVPTRRPTDMQEQSQILQELERAQDLFTQPGKYTPDLVAGAI